MNRGEELKMKNDCHKAVAPQFIFRVAFLSLFCVLALFELKDLALKLSGVFLLLLIVPFTPYCYIFDKEGISICYPLFPSARYLWKEVYSVKETTTTYHIGQKRNILNVIYRKRFKLIGVPKKKKRFYMTDSIVKTERTEALFRIYWKEKIQ